MKDYQPELIEVKDLQEAEKQLKAIGCHPASVKIMASKAVFRVIKLHGVRNAIANILKQEMLAVGGEAAVSAKTVSCVAPETDVLLMGTVKQFVLLAKKMKIQVSESKEVAFALEKALHKTLRR
jgi:dihydropteroate synthase